eukprot:s944_g12.t1
MKPQHSPDSLMDRVPPKQRTMKKFRAVALMEPCLWWMDIAASGIPLQKLEVLISKISAGRPSQDTIRLCVFEAIPEDSRDTYGNRLWPAAVHLATYLTIGSKSSGPGQRVLQLGCGNGLCSLAAASLGCRVLATDYRQLPLDLLRQAAEGRLGRIICRVDVLWGMFNTII